MIDDASWRLMIDAASDGHESCGAHPSGVADYSYPCHRAGTGAGMCGCRLHHGTVPWRGIMSGRQAVCARGASGLLRGKLLLCKGKGQWLRQRLRGALPPVGSGQHLGTCTPLHPLCDV